MSKIDTFEKMLADGNDNALLRYSLGNEYAQADNHVKALDHLTRAVELNPDYSAAWKLYAKTLKDSGDTQAAIAAYEKGIQVAEKNGDIQAVKEMRVFLKRLQK
ncbi:MAG: tetratricopeptide repeat protein [Gammaproteobacteria bacterium]